MCDATSGEPMRAESVIVDCELGWEVKQMMHFETSTLKAGMGRMGSKVNFGTTQDNFIILHLALILQAHLSFPPPILNSSPYNSTPHSTSQPFCPSAAHPRDQSTHSMHFGRKDRSSSQYKNIGVWQRIQNPGDDSIINNM